MSSDLIAALITSAAAIVATLLQIYLRPGSANASEEEPQRTEETGARKSGRPLWKLWRKRGLLLGVALGGALLGIVLVRLWAYATVAARIERYGSTYEDLIKAGVRAKKNYVLPAVVMNVRLDSATNESPLRLDADVRITYIIQAMGDSAIGFDEHYHTDVEDAFVFRLPATDRSSIVSHENTAQGRPTRISLNIRPGARRILTTGARYRFPPGKGPASSIFPRAGPREGEFCYPNDESLGDIIGNFSIFVESTTLQLRLNPDGGPSAAKANIPEEDGSISQLQPTPALLTQDIEHSSQAPRRMISAQWERVEVGREVCVKVWW